MVVAVSKPKFFGDRPIIQPGKVYEIAGVNYECLTATTDIIKVSDSGIRMTRPVYWFENIETGERLYLTEKELRKKFVK